MKVIVLTVISLLIISVKCNDRLNQTERERVRNLALKYARLSLAEREPCNDPDCATETSDIDLLDTEVGRAELIAINILSHHLDDSVLPESSVPQECSSEFDASLHNAYGNFFWNQVHLFWNQFQAYVESGTVREWPRYTYHPNGDIILLPEVISFRETNFDPSVPETSVGTSKNKLKASSDCGRNVRWVPETPQNLQNPDLYEPSHIIPLSIVDRFFNLVYSNWERGAAATEPLSAAEHQMITARGIFNLRVTMGHELRLGDTNNLAEMKERFGRKSLYNKNQRKKFPWAAGNLFYEFKNRASSDRSAEDELERGSEVIMGYDRFMRAQNIYNHMIDYLHRVGYTNRVQAMESEARQQRLNIIRRVIRSDEYLFHELWEICHEFMDFGLERNDPYPNDWRQWTKNKDNEWTIKTDDSQPKSEEPESLDSYYAKHIKNNPKRKDKDDDDDHRHASRSTLSNSLVGAACQIFGHGISRMKRSTEIDREEYRKFEDFVVENAVTNHTDAVYALLDLQMKNANRKSFRLDEINDLIRNEVYRIHLKPRYDCTNDDWICSRMKKLCQFLDESILLHLNEDDEPKDWIGNTLNIDPMSLISTISFDDWCEGRKFKYENYKITMDSAYVRLLTFNATQPSTVNKRTYHKLFKEFERSVDGGKKWDSFVHFVENQLQVFNSTASVILSQACEKRRESFNKEYRLVTLPIPDPHKTLMHGLCQDILLSMDALSWMYCKFTN